MDALVRSLAPLTTVNLGSYFMAMTNANQRGGILRQKGVNLMEMDLTLLPLNVTRSHLILHVIEPNFKLVNSFNSFSKAIVDEDISSSSGQRIRLVDTIYIYTYREKDWVIQQMLSPAQDQTERLNILESYYHDFIRGEAHTQDSGTVTKTLSKHAVAKDFAQQVGIRGMSDTNIIKYGYLWVTLSNIRAAGIQTLVLYRNGTMNTLLRNEMFRPADSRLRVSEVEEWSTMSTKMT